MQCADFLCYFLGRKWNNCSCLKHY